nr:uncharacterized protein LOC127491610 isoform X2 [Oryctolagus cuniculus]XP_051704668.1 uncharacterized protein LOC127491610 isoform X2 [Oryctolagus cuniculus]
MGSNQGSRTEAKPLPRGGPGRASRLLGGTVAVVLILGVALAVLFVCRRQKSRLGTLGDQTDLPPSQKLEPSPDRQSGHAPDGSQVLHLESGRRRQQQQEEEDEGEALQKLSLQPPYYDLGFSPAHHPLGSDPEDPDVYYAELDTSALGQVPGPRPAVPGPGEAVEYATIQLSPA